MPVGTNGLLNRTIVYSVNLGAQLVLDVLLLPIKTFWLSILNCVKSGTWLATKSSQANIARNPIKRYGGFVRLVDMNGVPELATAAKELVARAAQEKDPKGCKLFSSIYYFVTPFS